MIVGLCLWLLGSAVGSLSRHPYCEAHGSAQGVSIPPSANLLRSIVEDYTRGIKSLDAFAAPYFGLEEKLTEFGDYPSKAYFEREKTLLQQTEERLQALDTRTIKQWPLADRVLYELIRSEVRGNLEARRYHSELIAFNPMGNRLMSFLDDSSMELTQFPFDTVAHYEAFVERSRGLSAYVDAQIALLRGGIRDKITLNVEIARRVPLTYQAALEPDIERNPFFRPIKRLPRDLSAKDQKRLQTLFRRMIEQTILPQYRRFDDFYQKEYIPHCRTEGFGIGSLPQGKDWYQNEILLQTTLDWSPLKIHDIGLSEVDRIEIQLRELQSRMGGTGPLGNFIRKRNADPKNYYGSGAELLQAFADFKTEVGQAVPRFFVRLPRSDYRVVEQSNPESAAASYAMPTEFMPYGRFMINAQNLKAISRDRLRTLSLHEATPGHHFQLSLQYELKDELSEYQRKIYQSNAFAEGWALYAESLGREMGLLEDPSSLFGSLLDELLRAVRLVVDTGIHAQGWDRAQAFNYMKEKLAADDHDLQNEVNRYAVMPAQALSYKLGCLKIWELRRMAEAKLQDRFDLKRFHERVLSYGMLSLPSLELLVQDWTDQQLKDVRRTPARP